MTHLGAGIDELELDLFKGLPLGVNKEGLSQSEYTLLRSDTASLNHDKVLLHQTIMGESTHRVDGLVGQIVVGGSIVLDKFTILHVESITDVVDLFVDLGTVMVTLLTSTRHSVLDTTGMPGSDTSDLAETFMGLARQLFGMPTRSDTLESFTLGNTNDVDHFILAKDTFDWHFLFKVFTSKVDFVGN